MLPFARDAFLDVFAAYNEAVWPAQPVAWSLIGGTAAFLLGIVQDWVLLASGPAALLFAYLPARRPVGLRG